MWYLRWIPWHLADTLAGPMRDGAYYCVMRGKRYVLFVADQEEGQAEIEYMRQYE